MTKRDFLDNVRTARNLFVNPRVAAASRQLDPAALAQTLARAAIWLTPSSVKGFRADDFPELDPARRQELADAVRTFEQVARQVPPDKPADSQQLEEGKAALERVLAILQPYLPDHEETEQVREVLAKIDLPAIMPPKVEVGCPDRPVTGPR